MRLYSEYIVICVINHKNIYYKIPHLKWGIFSVKNINIINIVINNYILIYTISQCTF